MSGLEAAGSFLVATSLLISAIVGRDVSGFKDAYAHPLDRLRARVKEDGLFTALLLHTVFLDALSIMDRVERYVLVAEEKYVLEFIQSYNNSFNMIGVAGAIIAQVAISALSLPGLGDTHWTAHAFFTASLTSGALSVFFSCAINPAFHGLHSPENIKDFLSKPSVSSERKSLKMWVDKTRKDFGWHFRKLERDQVKQLRAEFEDRQWKVSSPFAAMILVTPMVLLRLALNMFLLGLGIYLGKLYTARLVPQYGSGSLGSLIFFVASAMFGMMLYYLSQGSKYWEDLPLRQWRRIVDDYNSFHVDKITHDQLRQRIMKNLRNELPALSMSGSGAANKDPLTLQLEDRTAQTRAIETMLDKILQHGGAAERPSVAKNGADPTASTQPEIEPEANRLLPESNSQDVNAVLRTLIRAQEESLEATKKLLELQMSSRT